MRISDWSSDVCSSDLLTEPGQITPLAPAAVGGGGNVFALTGRFEPDGTEDQEATESTDGGTNNNNLNDAAGSGTVSYLWGDNGNDTLNGGNGSDILNGGPGSDGNNGGDGRGTLGIGGGVTLEGAGKRQRLHSRPQSAH